MRIFKWDSKFSPTKEFPIAPVWIRIEGLPLYLFEDNSLCSISNAIGNPLRIDPRNINRAILSRARICVELDVSKPFIDSIWITPDVNALAQRIKKTSFATERSLHDVPSSTNTALNSYHQDKRSKHTKVWIESKGTRAMKSQLQNTSYKDKALSIENSLSSLDSPFLGSVVVNELVIADTQDGSTDSKHIGQEALVLDVVQNEGIIKEFQSDLQKVLQVEKVELTEADLKKKNTQIDKHKKTENKVLPNQAMKEVEGTNLIVPPDVYSSGADNSEVAPTNVTSSQQIGELAPVDIMTQVGFITLEKSSNIPSTTTPNSWAIMVEEEEQEHKIIAI
ncbi:hypothetical protein LIER_40557 [Lithospermum erythrorhizon]|uniref:DUF4283 domain-containing protein n=1 Tax=Lithospermum erythrorhizon TaxID=34254 RepID=A0AAV3QYL8_LITER